MSLAHANSGDARQDSYKGAVPGASRHRIWTLPLAATLLAMPGVIFGEDDIPQEPVVTTTWEVRRAAADTLTELRRGDDIPTVFEHIRELCAQNGDALIEVNGVFSPLADVLAQELITLKLAERYAQTYSASAENAVAELRERDAAAEDWRRMARTYPGTEAAAIAWRRLADRSWDFGNLGTYVSLAPRAGDTLDATLRKRVEAARALLRVYTSIRLPTTLDLQEMWRLELPIAEIAPPQMRRGNRNGVTRATFVLSETSDDLTAASDGISCFLFDHLVGHRVGELHTIGGTPLTKGSCRPAAWAGGFIALGQDRNGVPTLTAIDRQGVQQWRVPLAGDNGYGSLSAPIVVDKVVATAVLATNEEGPELRIVAHSVVDGTLAWDRFIAKLPILMGRQMFFNESSNSSAPLLIRHGGGLLVMPNTGMMARLDALGEVQRIWTYPTLGGRMEDRFLRRREDPRMAGLASDGQWAVATPTDAEGFTWILGPDMVEPIRYQGDGARNTVVAVRDGQALLVGKQTTLLDLATQKPLWHQSTGAEQPSGVISDNHILVAGLQQLTLLDRKNGSTISDRGAEPPVAFAAADGMVIVAGKETLVAYGNAEAFIAEQKAAIARTPEDYRPYVALGKVWAAQGKVDQAFNQLVLGLQRGAPADYAITAARLLRNQLEIAVDDEVAFTATLTRFEELLPYSPNLNTETMFWRARRAEHAGNKKAAQAAYQAVMAAPPARITFGRSRDAQIDVSLGALAQAGLARLGIIEMPAWLVPSPAPVTPTLTENWEITTSRSRTGLVAGTTHLGYEGGRLVARSLATGQEMWARRPDMRLLGVKLSPTDAADPGVPIEVLEGTAAAAAGLKSGDVITQFNERPIRDFYRDLISAVSESPEGGPFEITVLRNGQTVTVKGNLGGELIEAFAANAATALAWPVMPVAGRRGQGEGMWVTALDLATGTELLRWPLPPITMERSPPRPIITDRNILITVDGQDLLALDVRADAANRERWRIPGQGIWLDQASMISQGTLLISDVTHGAFRLINTDNGEVLAMVHGNADTKPGLHGSDFVVRTTDGRLACWDLGKGRLRWRSEQPIYQVVAVRGDAVFALDERKGLLILDLVNGALRRRYGDVTLVDNVIRLYDRLAILARRSDGERVVSMISLPAGSPLWERVLPRNTEIREFTASESGTMVVLAEQSQKPSALVLNNDGKVQHARVLEDQDVLLLVGSGLLQGNITSLRGLGAPLTTELPDSVTVTKIDEGTNLITSLTPVMDKAQWNTIGDASYAVFAMGNSRIFVAQLPMGTDTLKIRIGTGTAPIDVHNQQLIFQRHRVARFNDLDDGWRLNSGKRLPSDDQTWIFAVRLDPPVGLTPGSRVAIRASTNDDTDGQQSPWWLRRIWRPLQDIEGFTGGLPSPLSLPQAAPAPGQP